MAQVLVVNLDSVPVESLIRDFPIRLLSSGIAKSHPAGSMFEAAFSDASKIEEALYVWQDSDRCIRDFTWASVPGAQYH
jgi:hypothetical protein